MDKIKLEARREAKRLEAIENRIAEEKNQKHVSYIDISIEWKKSRTWGNNPYLNAIIHYKDNTRESYDTMASGCGYCKESTVIGQLFNHCMKYKLYEKSIEGKELPYGMEANKYKGYGQGVGVECYYRIGEAIGGIFEKVASGKSFDAYKYTDNSK